MDGGCSVPQGTEGITGGDSGAVASLCYNCGKDGHRLADCPKVLKMPQ